MKRVVSILLLLTVISGAGLAVAYWVSMHSAAPERSARVKTASTELAPSYIYYTLKDARGFVLAQALRGSNGQPISAPQTIAVLGNGFGLSTADNVTSMQLSPDGNYLAINGTRDHGDQVWIYATQHKTISLVPAHVSGNFLHWLPRGNGHTFLYRPVLPLGPGLSLDNRGWNPGLWTVDAASGTYQNLDIGTPSVNLIDAAPSPDGAHVIYSTTTGLGQGSDIFEMNSDGSGRVSLFQNHAEAQAIVGLFAWSPDGKNIAFERLSDSATPFLPASIWVMNQQGAQQRHLAEADGGHGFMLSWSPDSSKIAFVARANAGDRHADAQAQALQCSIGVVDVASAHSWLVASPQQTGEQMNINPTWTADSASITFTALNPTNRVVGGTPRYWSAHISGSQMKPSVTPITPALQHVVATQ
ncbi:hypothetical protein EPA93_25935 [Ktedonosporobacter rubrisoli]|uniref:WD40 repeat domain-containing protein n=1 Tax=Ktedonosporobacter rubrisoli TaxID=2509675 RepID=A0A4P6JW65_KTERU|nr:PD40 domain-containing protein [Ktedonosporobacter rubrisoli]QBD79236.1 hypothetical protein EPA93_25935 [Ktedonosporobacter rubrisoli]